MKIVLINGNDQERSIYRIYLENIVGDDEEILETDNVYDGLKNLDRHKDCGLVVCTNNMNDGSASDIYSYLQNNASQIPFVFLAPEITEIEGFQKDNPLNTHITLPTTPSKFRETIVKVLGHYFGRTQTNPAFQKVRLIHFYRYNKVLCNVYLRLSKNKYVKVINANNFYTRDDLDKFRLKDIHHLYVSNSDATQFEISFLRPSSFLTTDLSGLDQEEISKNLTSTHFIMQDLVTHLGFNREVVELAQKSVDNILEFVEKNEDLSKIFTSTRTRKDYVYDHSYLVSIVCCEILRQMKWDNDDNVKNLCLASLFHDITLTNPELAMIDSSMDERLDKFSPQEINTFLGHPFDTAELIKQTELANYEVINIIKQHHENIEGTGFPERLKSNEISTLTCIFLIAHDYINKMYAVDFHPQMNLTVIKELVNKYLSDNFKEPVRAFFDAFKNI